jgi:glycosyltransferase involved in cell wall biosynthesis
VLLEAMEAGLPLIAIRVEGVEEVIVDGSNGLLLPPGDPEALKFALQRLLAQPDLRVNLGAAGKTLVQEAFRLDQMGRRYEGLFLRLLEGDR